MIYKTLKEAAALLDGDPYRFEGSEELFKQFKNDGIVAVFGYSDDGVEFRGRLNDEMGYGSQIYLDTNGIMESDCEDDGCPYFLKTLKGATKLEVYWCEDDEYSWTYDIEIHYETFDIMEDDNKYCQGILFYLDDCRTKV